MRIRSTAKWLVRTFLSGDRAEPLLGDFEEQRASEVHHVGRFYSDLRYLREAIIAIVFYMAAELAHRYVGNGRSIVTHHQRFGSVVIHVGRNALALAAFWLTASVFIQVTQRAFDGWRAAALAEFSACAIGVLLSVRLRAHLATFFLAGQVAFTVSEFAMHSAYSIRAVQGAPTHFAVMISATIGVLLGALLITIIVPRTASRRIA